MSYRTNAITTAMTALARAKGHAARGHTDAAIAAIDGAIYQITIALDIKPAQEAIEEIVAEAKAAA